MTVLIDSWTWIEYWRGGIHSERAAEYIEGSETAVLSAVNLVEIFFWVLRHYDEKRAVEKRDTLRRRCFLIPLDETVAVDAAKTKRNLRLSLADSIILATARAHDAKLVTGDKDFKSLPDILYIGD